MNDAAVVRRIATTMIPVTLNTDRIPDGAGGKFFKEVMATSRWPQGIWIVAPDGKFLAFHYFRVASGESPARSKTRWVKETLETVERGLKEFGDVAPRPVKPHNPLPERGVGLRSDGGVRFAAYATFLRNGRRDEDPVVDSVILSGDEWKLFIPTQLEVGAEWTLPEAVAKRFAPVLAPITDSIFSPLPKDAKSAKLSCRVEMSGADRVLCRLTGAWETEHFREDDPKLPIRATATADGYLEYDTVRKRVTSLLLVFHGTYRNVPPWNTIKPTGGVVEWKLENRPDIK